MNLTDKVAVITGAGSGIGRATAHRFAQAGANICACDVNAERLATLARELGPRAMLVETVDVSDRAQMAGFAERVHARTRAADIVVNNAGVGVGGPFLEARVEDWDWLIGINLNGVAYGCRAFGGPMVQRGRGHVVNIASGAAFVMSRDMAAYCASKAAVLALSRCLRADWAGTGVGVSAICPGVIDTPIPGNSRMVGAMAARQERIVKAFRRGHAPDLVAKAIVRAVERDQAVVPVGVEAELAYRLLPFVPGRVQHFAAKTQLGRFI
jgi:NADP-dependent 3-hydroxy acid dehydrogenase YdfG